jgi:tetratricopeptide (TPR) repeat protein
VKSIPPAAAALALVPIGCVLLMLGVRWQREQSPPPAPPVTQPGYVREDPPDVENGYVPPVPFMEQTPSDLDFFLGRIAEIAQLPRRVGTYPTDPDTIHRTAQALISAARETYGVSLSLQDSDPAQLDRLANEKLIDERLRPFFAGDRLRADLTRAERRAQAAAVREARVPDEPLLYYALGCFWGEWLVAQRGFLWRLYPPLRPVQAFPAFVAIDQTACVHPFSHVTRKLADPEGGALALAVPAAALKRYFPPFLLTASPSDAAHAVREGTPGAVRQAREAATPGEAVTLFQKALTTVPPTAHLYALAGQAAWDSERWDLAEAWLRQGLELQPRHPVLSDDLARVYARMPDGLERAVPLLEEALAEDPDYARARLRLASCLLQLGRKDEARRQARWVLATEPALKDEAAALVARIR